MIGRRRNAGLLADHLHRLIAVHLRHHDVHQHDREVRRRFDERDRLAAGRRGQHLHAAPFEHAAQREDVARVVVDQQHRPADQVLVGAVQPLDHALLVVRQVGDDAVQEQRGFVEQPLRRFDPLDDDAARHRVQLRILLGRQFAAGEDDDRQVGERRVVAHLFEQFEAGHVGQPQVEHDAVGARLAQRRRAPRRRCRPCTCRCRRGRAVRRCSAARPDCPRRSAAACGAA